MARWRVRLSAYGYDPKYQLGKTQQKADGLRRLPLPLEIDKASIPDVLRFDAIPVPQLTTSTIVQMTSKDPVLSRLYSGL